MPSSFIPGRLGGKIGLREKGKPAGQRSALQVRVEGGSSQRGGVTDCKGVDGPVAGRDGWGVLRRIVAACLPGNGSTVPPLVLLPCAYPSCLPARAAQPPLPPPTATGEKAPVAPQNPTGEMFEAARKDGLRGCIIALLSPPGLKMGPSKMEQLIKKVNRLSPFPFPFVFHPTFPSFSPLLINRLPSPLPSLLLPLPLAPFSLE